MKNPQASAELATKLRELADKLQKDIDDKTRPLSQNWTAKRGREFSGRCHDGENLRRAQQALRVLAEAHEYGACPKILTSIRTKSKVLELVATRGESSGYYDYRDSGVPRDNTPEGIALRRLVELVQTDGEATASTSKKAQDTLTTKLNELRRLDIPGFFPTPQEVARRVIDAANIYHEHRVLEPSAGIGSLADLCPNKANVDCIEQSHALAEILSMRGFAAINRDFLDEVPTTIYDRIVMNPPFENAQDIAHIQHAYRFLRRGGRLVAICSTGPFFRSDKKSVAFRGWLEMLGAVVEDLPAESFNSKDAFRRTGVACKLVIIDRD